MAEQDNSIFKLFGFELKRASEQPKEKEKLKSKGVDDWATERIAASNFDENSVEKISNIG